MSRTARITALVDQANRIDAVEAAFRACACLSDSQRAALERRFNATFGQCTPPLSLAFHQPEPQGASA